MLYFEYFFLSTSVILLHIGLLMNIDVFLSELAMIIFLVPGTEEEIINKYDQTNQIILHL